MGSTSYNLSTSTIRIIGYILAGLIFFGTIIRSFINHNFVLDGIKMISKKHRKEKKEKFTKEKEAQYKREHEEPKIEQI